MAKFMIVPFALFVLVASVAGQKDGRRCGFDDAEHQREKRYVLNNQVHNQKVFYKITDYSKNLSHAIVDETIKRAFSVWSEQVDLEFVQLDSNSDDKPDITIRFVVRDHGDGFPFDGPGGVLAHALKHYVHFDDEETWKFSVEEDGTNLYSVAVHEIGHSLGLGHTDVEGAIMFPWYQDFDETKLHDDDILGIQEVYEKKKDNSNFNLNLCKDPEFDTIFSTADGKIFIFKSDMYYELDGLSIVDGPRKISETWKELPTDINAAFTQNGKTFFFKNDLYWRYTGTTLDKEYPERLARYYSEIPDGQNSAMVGADNKVYFFKGSNYYRMDSYNEQYTNVTQGKLANDFQGIPTRVDAAFYHPHHRRTYFFKEGSFYVYDSSSKDHPSYAIPVNTYFFNC